jgi:hypothetical protein
MMKACVELVLREKSLVRAAFGDGAVVEDEDHVGMADGGEPMRDRDLKSVRPAGCGVLRKSAA